MEQPNKTQVGIPAPYNAEDADYELVEVLGVRGLYTPAELYPKTIPSRFCCYKIGEDSAGKPSTVFPIDADNETKTIASTLLLEHPFVFEELGKNAQSISAPGEFRCLGSFLRLSGMGDRPLGAIPATVQPERISVETPFGLLYAELGSHTGGPGISIYLDSQEDGGTIQDKIVVVEATEDHPADGDISLRTLLYEGGDEMYSTDITYQFDPRGNTRR